MNKVLAGFQRVRTFFREVVNELKKSSWPTKNELLESTVVVIVSVVLFSAFVGLSDTVLGSFNRLLLH